MSLMEIENLFFFHSLAILSHYRDERVLKYSLSWPFNRNQLTKLCYAKYAQIKYPSKGQLSYIFEYFSFWKSISDAKLTTFPVRA